MSPVGGNDRQVSQTETNSICHSPKITEAFPGTGKADRTPTIGKVRLTTLETHVEYQLEIC